MSLTLPVVVCFVIERDRHVLLLRRSAWKDEAPVLGRLGAHRSLETLRRQRPPIPGRA